MARGKFVAAVIVFMVFVGIASGVYKLWLVPTKERADEKIQAKKDETEAKEKQELMNLTSSDSRYDYNINFAIDSFSGYAVCRSETFKKELTNRRIKLNLVDDGADYASRLQKLKSGDIQMGVFTIDALIKACADDKSVPASIVYIVDETRGADAMVAYKDAFPNLDALNDPDVKFILPKGSPAETLARVVMSNFNLRNLKNNPFIFVKDAKAVYEAYRKAKPGDKNIFVLWEPYVTKLLENPNTHVLVDSGRFRGYIVDVIVANRDFLAKNKEVVQTFVESYCRSYYKKSGMMLPVVIEDAKKSGQPLSPKAGKRLVDGVWWKTTPENNIHMGLVEGELQHIEDIILNITKVLKTTGAIDTDPTDGNPNILYFKGIQEQMIKNNFRPGMADESVREDKIILSALSDKQWEDLIPIGQLDVQPVVFGRGTSRISSMGKNVLKNLMETLKTCPKFYVLIRGNGGDAELANSRATAVKEFLISNGVGKNRVRAIAGKPSNSTSVDFVLGQQF